MGLLVAKRLERWKVLSEFEIRLPQTPVGKVELMFIENPKPAGRFAC